MRFRNRNAARIAENDQAREELLARFLEVLAEKPEQTLVAFLGTRELCDMLTENGCKTGNLSAQLQATCLCLGLMQLREKVTEAIESGAIEKPEGW